MTKEIITRFAPSPTGPFHVGGARTALFNYLFSKKEGGKMILRIEDTDKERSKPEWEKEIIDSLDWLGVSYDAVYRQSEREGIYQKYLEEILQSGKAYRCFCSKEQLAAEREQQAREKLPPRYSGKCREISPEESEERAKKGDSFVVRFKVPQERREFDDLVHGKISEDMSNLSDFIIARGMEALFNFVNVVDDFEMKVSHVIRGEDHIPNTFKHILLFEAFSWEAPRFGHIPLLLSKDRKKISKRDADNLPLTVSALRKKGVLQEAAINFLVLLGWNPGTEEEFFSLKELEKRFSPERIGKSASIYDLSRLEFFNATYIRKISLEDFAEKIKKEMPEVPGNFPQIARTIQDRIRFLEEAPELLAWFFDYQVPSTDLILNEKMKVDATLGKMVLEKSLELLEAEDDFSEESLKNKFMELISELSLKNGQVLWPVRAALTGKKFSPGAFEVASCLGKEESLRRIREAIKNFG